MKINKANYDTQAHRNRKTDKYYTSRQHKSIRKQAYMRDGGKCVGCGKDLALHTTKENREFMAFADHIKPREAGGTDELDNYQTLCASCHDSKSNKDKKHYR